MVDPVTLEVVDNALYSMEKEMEATIVRAAIPLVERQLELVRTRQQRLAEFSDELSEKLRTLRKRERELERKPRS